jgi:membrane-associated phospholipid phosphatase
MYQDDPDNKKRTHSDDDISSFYSGHAAIAFATAASMSYMFSMRHKNRKAKTAVWITSMTAAASVGLLRVFAGRHFWTDVITGAVIGTSTGILIPALHLNKSGKQLTITAGVRNINLLVQF